MSCRPLTRWLFGKLPSLGDFIWRGLDPAARDALDAWLSSEVQAARARFAGEFELRWWGAPPWCFADRDGEGRWSGGALCASVDAAGRMFPIVLAMPAGDGGEAARLAAGCLDLVECALRESWDADRLHTAGVTPVDAGWEAAEPTWVIPAHEGLPLEVPGRFPAGVITRMLEVAA